MNRCALTKLEKNIYIKKKKIKMKKKKIATDLDGATFHPKQD